MLLSVVAVTPTGSIGDDIVSVQTDEELRRQLAEAIARCCGWGNNRVEFGNEGSVEPLVGYLASKDPVVHRSTARALHQLSRDPDNCVSMHGSGVVRVNDYCAIYTVDHKKYQPL